MKKKKTSRRHRRDPIDFNYLDVAWDRTFKPKWSDSGVELTFYKGKVLLSVPYGTERAKALQEQTGFVVAGSAWLRDKDIDKLIALLREGRRVFRRHRADVMMVMKCKPCSKIFGGVCDKHRVLFRTYEKPKTSRGLR